ncbi:MAG: UvrD-helicase domain-containing protein [Oscillospiraceae bacterium]|nr:UvrD-helicase domain-containing protein [Oscillospiraceae bacterium]
METNAFTSAKRRALNKYFSRLNDMQKKAVFTVQGAVLVLAGAGSGKTSVLVSRIVNMVKFGNAYASEYVPASIGAEDIDFLNSYNGEKDEAEVSKLADIAAENRVKPWNILAITFTNKAANELKERLLQALGKEALDVTAATFHSACVRILRREIVHLGYDNNFTIYDADDSLRLIKNCLAALDISDKRFPPKSVAGIISSAKDKLIPPDLFDEDSENDFRQMTIARVYSEYQKRLREANALDFDDIIRLTVKLFDEHADVLERYQNRYKYIMVDEYQDTNTAQFRLVSLLAAKYKNFCAVGDDDQSIYKFRGATIENILSFERHFPNAAVIRLEQNYRSTQNILNAANAVIKNNEARKEKKLWTAAGDGEKVTVYKAVNEFSESRFVANKILDGVKQGRNYKDFAVLYRMNAQSNSIEGALTSSGLQYRVIGGLRFYDRKEVRDIIAYLSVINNCRDMLRFRRIINEPKRGIGDSTLSLIEHIAFDLNMSPVEVMKNSHDYPVLSKKASLLTKTAAVFEKLAAIAEEKPLDELLDALLNMTGYKAYMDSLGEEGITRLENIRELKSNMVAFMNGKAEQGEAGSLSEFLEEISLYTDADRLDPNADAVSVMTMHSAKGLEFPVVFIIGAEEGIFPGTRSLDSLEDLEEERRLAYVAVTRAKEKLYITHALQRMLFGNTSRNIASRFVKEIPYEYVERESGVEDLTPSPLTPNPLPQPPTLSTKSAPQASPLNTKATFLKPAKSQEKNPPVKLSVGDRVRHNVFGEGMVISVKVMSNDMMLEIAFDTAGTKKLMANYAKIVKI